MDTARHRDAPHRHNQPSAELHLDVTSMLMRIARLHGLHDWDAVRWSRSALDDLLSVFRGLPLNA
jgi:hypothetical protein